jgi:cyclophilin family peptidyl-prolyl cis-trans isomerase/HEAT repeat protein
VTLAPAAAPGAPAKPVSRPRAATAPKAAPVAPAKPASRPRATAAPAAPPPAPAAPAVRIVSADTIPDVRLTPLERIAKAEDERVLAGGPLPAALADPDPAVRRRAALAVGRLQDSAGVELLVPLLEDRDAEVKREAAFALGQIGLAHPATPERPAPARAALERVTTDPDAATAELALEALGKLGDRAATPRVAGFLGHASAALRGAAALALWRLADSTALDPLLQALDDADAPVRWRAIYALERIPSPDAIVLYVAMHVDDPDPLVRAFAVRTLGRQKSPQGTAYVLQKLADGDPRVTVNAIRALALIADTTCGSCLPALTGVLRASDPYLRVTAATALADPFAWAAADSASRRAALDSLAARLADPDAATRGAALQALIARLGAEALPHVQPLLADSSPYARAAALRGLGALPEPSAAPLLVPRLAPGAPLLERATAAEALGQFRSRAVAGALEAALADTSTLFVAAVAGALQQAADTAAVPLLARAWAEHAGDRDEDARASIRDALRELAGAPFADSVARAWPVTTTRVVYDSAFFAPPAAHGAVIRTSRGEIEWAFCGAADEAPQTVKNFVRLAGRGYFDGCLVHRVVPNFVIQDGDPTGTGSGGPGWTIRCEYNRLRYDRGMVGMALSGKDTGGSQWFVTHSPQPHLNGRYTIFARVTRGMDVVDRIVQGDRILGVEILR